MRTGERQPSLKPGLLNLSGMAGFIDLLDHLRSGAWLTRERVRLVALAVLAASVIGLVFLVATSDGLQRPLRPPARHRLFQCLCRRHLCAGRRARRALRPGPAICPRAGDLRRRRRRSTAGTIRRSSSASPRCWRPCLIWLALLMWQGVTLGLYLWAIRGIVGPQDKLWPLARARLPGCLHQSRPRP